MKFQAFYKILPHNIIKLMLCSTMALLVLACTQPSGTSGKENTDNKKEVQNRKIQEKQQEEKWWKKAAEKMVKEQIAKRGIQDKALLEVMRNTPRHLFVPLRYRRSAYQDRPLPIGEDQTISQPYIVAMMTDLINLSGDEKVLEIGTGSGYQAAILAQLAGQVYTIEIVKKLADSAGVRLTRIGYENIHTLWGDGYKGWPEHALFDRIIVTAAPEKVPPRLVEQLKPGGKMVLPVGKYFQKLKVITKTPSGKIKEKNITGVRFVPMIHPDKPIPEKDE